MPRARTSLCHSFAAGELHKFKIQLRRHVPHSAAVQLGGPKQAHGSSASGGTEHVPGGRPAQPFVTGTCLRLCIAEVPPRPFRDGCDSSASSENRQWIERRSCSFFDAQRRSREQKFVAVQPPRLLDRSLEIEIIENVYAHRDQRQPM